MNKNKFLRTCLVCNSKYEKKSADLARFVWPVDSDNFLFDADISQLGRGGYVCKKDCKDKILNPKLIGKIKHFMKRK